MSSLLSYVLVTPAHNESQFIERTIKSVISQKAKPTLWVIVDDGSTDDTAAIVGRYSSDNKWIRLVRLPAHDKRSFAFKAHAFNAGYSEAQIVQHDAVGCIDADIVFEEEFFSFLLKRLEDDTTLGLVGAAFSDPNGFTYNYRFVSIEHVSGPCQLFRRQCFEEIGGYVPVRTGGVDRIANIAARMHGWSTRTFLEQTYLHLRPMGTAKQSVLKSRFNDGIKDYSVGSHPAWELFRTIYQMWQRPVVLGGISLACGYVWANVKRLERPVTPEFVRFCRMEQMHRLKRFFATIFGRKSKGFWAELLRECFR